MNDEIFIMQRITTNSILAKNPARILWYSRDLGVNLSIDIN
jgi:hypothetical protein